MRCSQNNQTSPASAYRVEIGGIRPFAITRRQMLKLLPAPRLIQRLLATAYHPAASERWLELAREGRPGCEVLVVTSSFETACVRLSRGERPPLLDCEKRRNRGSTNQYPLPPR